MFRLFFRNRQEKIDKEVERINRAHEGQALTDSLEENVKTIQKLYEDVDILRVRYVDNNHDKSLKYGIVYCEGVVNSAEINDNIIKPLMLSPVRVSGGNRADVVMKQIVQIGGSKTTQSVKDIAEAIAGGDTVLFISDEAQAVIFKTKNFNTRTIAEPDNERTLSGPREGFTESLMLNLSLIRRKVLTPELKMKSYSFGRRTHTRACVCYMDGLVNKAILAELYRRLDAIDIDAVLDTNYITELIKESGLSLFRTTGFTERPDVVVGKLMEGRIALFLDGTPVVLTIPYLFMENFQSSEDYYVNFLYSSLSRLIRLVGFFLTIAVPGLYVSIVAYHHEMLTLPLLINLAAERQSVPMPAALEAFIMLAVFDILRETGVRMPSNLGQALSIVGALVIGQAAVEARLVAAPMIVVIALTGITNLLIPKLNAAVIYIRIILLFAATCFGFFGLVLGIACVLIHVINLRSFGVSQVMLSGELRYQELKDTIIRAPWWQMIRRPWFAANSVRLNGGGDRRG